MRVRQDIYEQLLSAPAVPPEAGGILGSRRQGILDAICWDPGVPFSLQNGRYVPDITFFNSVIAQWNTAGIRFSGIFHTHLPQWDGLSHGDRQYIVRILESMPPSVRFLYFPIVFPGQAVKPYLASRRTDGLVRSIQKDTLIVVKGDITHEKT